MMGPINDNKIKTQKIEVSKSNEKWKKHSTFVNILLMDKYVVNNCIVSLTYYSY